MSGSVAGVILAGGLARRMGGGDKCLLSLKGRTLLDAVLERAGPQVDALLLNANGDSERFSRFRLPVKQDVVEGYAGPLAGILTGMQWAAEQRYDWLVSFAADTPFFPTDMVQRLLEQASQHDLQIVCARSTGRAHPVFALWQVALADELRQAMEQQGMRKIDRWTAQYSLGYVDFEDDLIDPFFNINSPEDLEVARSFQ